MDDKQMTLKQAAEMFGYAPDTLRQAVLAGALEATKFGNTWVVTDAAVRAYQAGRRGKVGRPRRPRRQPPEAP